MPIPWLSRRKTYICAERYQLIMEYLHLVSSFEQRDVYIQINPNIKCNWSKFWKLPKIEYCWIILDLHMWRVLPSDFKFLFRKRLLASDFKFLFQNRINYYYYFWKLFYCDYIIIVLIWFFYNFPRKKKDFLQL